MENFNLITAQERIVHIDWSGPLSLAESYQLNNQNDYGLYAIYGNHFVYGNSVLLYLGKAQEQTFGKRLSQEKGWQYNSDADRVQVYVGRFGGHDDPESDDTWSKIIDISEKLMIYAHAPALNSKNVNGLDHNAVRSIHILNWGNVRSLLPEVSGQRWTNEHHRETWRIWGE